MSTTATPPGTLQVTQTAAIAALEATGASVEILERSVITGSVHLHIRVTTCHGSHEALCAPSGRVHRLA